MHLSPRGRADPHRLAESVATLRAELPFLPDAACTAWQAPSGRCAVATAGHAPGQVGGVRYTAAEPARVAAFSGRPFLWTDEFEADGRAALEAALYLRPAREWIDRIDGRWAAVRYDDEEGVLEVCSDPLGSYPVYMGGRGELFFSNSPELVRRLAGEGRFVSRPSVLASFFACGASIDGVPRWEDVERLPAGVQRFRAADGVRSGPDSIDWLPLLGERFDAEVASRRLVAVVGALADWPGRPAFVGLSGGRDSRVVFAAALAAGVDIEPRTMAIPGAAGYPATRDVVLARALCGQAGLALEVVEPRTTLPPARLATLCSLVSPGTISLELAAQAAFARPIPTGHEPVEILETGHCGELARAYYGTLEAGAVEAVTERLLARTLPSIPRPLLSAAGKATYRGLVEGWAARQSDAGVSASLLLDVFYLDQRMPHWIAVSQGISEYLHDLANPLWSRRLIPQEVGLAPEERRRELFHLHVLEALAPDLLEIPFDVEPLWHRPERSRSLSAGYARTAAKLVRELRRSVLGHAGPDLLPDLVRNLRDAVELEDPSSWEVLDRRRVDRLLTRNPHRLDRRSRSMLWRLATVLLAEDRPAVRVTAA